MTTLADQFKLIPSEEKFFKYYSRILGIFQAIVVFDVVNECTNEIVNSVTMQILAFLPLGFLILASIVCTIICWSQKSHQVYAPVIVFSSLVTIHYMHANCFFLYGYSETSPLVQCRAKAARYILTKEFGFMIWTILAPVAAYFVYQGRSDKVTKTTSNHRHED